MAGSGDTRWILVTSNGYVKKDGTVTPDPNEAFHGNVYNAGGRFASAERVVQSLCEATQYTGERAELTYATFTNWTNEEAKNKHNVLSLHELGYSDRTFLSITEDDLYIYKKQSDNI